MFLDNSRYFISCVRILQHGFTVIPELRVSQNFESEYFTFCISYIFSHKNEVLANIRITLPRQFCNSVANKRALLFKVLLANNVVPQGLLNLLVKIKSSV